MGRPSYASVAATAALVLAAGGLAVAKNPGDDGVIRGCLKTGTKILRVPDSARCRPEEKKLSWNKEGRPGLSGYQIVPGNTDAATGANLAADSTATCPKGKKAIGGGFAIDDQSSGVTPVFSKPFQETQWIVHTTNEGGGAYTMTAYAVCATVAP